MSFLDVLKTDPAKARRFSVYMVALSTCLGAAAQILMKSGAQMQQQDSALMMLVAIFTTPQLFIGYCLYAMFTFVLVIALKYGELSILYPVIALTYVWVTILSVLIYKEILNPYKVAGLTTVVLGVAVLGRASRR